MVRRMYTYPIFCMRKLSKKFGGYMKKAAVFNDLSGFGKCSDRRNSSTVRAGRTVLSHGISSADKPDRI